MPQTRTLHIAIMLLALFAGLGCLTPARAEAASSLRMMNESGREIVWNLNADRMLTTSGGSVVEAFGKVELRMGNDYLRADFARYFASTGWVYLYGSIELKMGDDLLSAQEAEFDLVSRSGWLNKGRVFIAESNTYFAAERIIKHRGSVYSFSDLTFTTCDGDSPAWSFSAGTAVLEVDGYAQLWGSKFRVADQPVFYSPYLIVPAKASRQSGLLMPDAGHSSRLGFFYTQPFYWVIDDSRDLTLTESFMSRRGFLHGVNYRSRGSEDESLWLSFDYIDDRRTVNEPYDKYFDDSPLLRTNSQRYWVRGMYDVRLPVTPQWRFRADVDYVSDQQYLRDFKRGLQGYGKTRDALFATFSRDLRELDDERQSGAMLFRDWERLGLYLSGSYAQNPELGHGNEARSRDDTVQRLPELGLYLQQGRLVDFIPLELAGSGQAGYFYRREGTSGGRFDVSPRLTLPISGRYGSLSASAGLHSTWYRTERRADSLTPGSPTPSREKSRFLQEYQASAGTELARVYQIQGPDLSRAGESRWVGLKHSIIPRLSYDYLPEKDQSDIPYFTSYDYMPVRHEVTWAVDTLLTRKRERLLERTNQQTQETELYRQYDYQDVARLHLEQAYSIHEARRNDDLDQYPREPWRDVIAELTLYWDEYLAFFSRTYWTPSEDSFTRHSHGLYLKLPEWGSFSTSLTHRKPVDDYYTQVGPAFSPNRRITERLTTASFEGEIKVWGPWSASAYYDWDIKGDGKNEKGLAINYNHQCFTLGGQIIRDEDDTIFRVRFSLSGLGF